MTLPECNPETLMQFSRRDEIRKSRVFILSVPTGFRGSQGEVDLADAIEFRKPILLMMDPGEPPKAFLDYDGPKHICHEMTDDGWQKIKAFFAANRIEYSGGLLDRPFENRRN